MGKTDFNAPPVAPVSANWDDLRAVAELVTRGTLGRAGEGLGVNYTTISRRIARAEAALSVALFERLADGYRPTEEGRLVADHVARMAEEDHALMRALAGRDGGLTGALTITAPQLLIAHVLAPALRIFREAHPDLELHIRATNDRLDLTRREADLGIRISPDPGDTLTGVRLAEQNSASFASADWAARIRNDPKAPIDWILYEGHQTLPKGVAEAWPSSRVRYRFDDMIAMAGAAQAGLGVVRMPMFLGRALPGLEQVPLLPPKSYPAIWMVGHPDVWKGAKVRAFREVVGRYVKERRAVFL